MIVLLPPLLLLALSLPALTSAVCSSVQHHIRVLPLLLLLALSLALTSAMYSNVQHHITALPLLLLLALPLPALTSTVYSSVLLSLPHHVKSPAQLLTGGLSSALPVAMSSTCSNNKR
jgi:hypothetical protein